jgi:hypothetical protein
VKVEDTVKDVHDILNGKVDSLTPEDLLFIGTLKDLEEKINSKINASSQNIQNNPQLNLTQPPNVAQSNTQQPATTENNTTQNQSNTQPNSNNQK